MNGKIHAGYSRRLGRIVLHAEYAVCHILQRPGGHGLLVVRAIRDAAQLGVHVHQRLA